MSGFSSHSGSSASAVYSSSVIDRFEYWHETMKSSRPSLQSARTTRAGMILPERVDNSSMASGLGIAGTWIIFLNRMFAWSSGYPFSSSARTFMFGTRRLTSTSLDIYRHPGPDAARRPAANSPQLRGLVFEVGGEGAEARRVDRCSRPGILLEACCNT